MVGKLYPMTFRGTSLGCCASGKPLNLVRCLLQDVLLFRLFLFELVVLLTLCIFRYVVKEHPELESRFEGRVQEAIKYANTIKDFDKLVDPRILARHYLGLEPSLYVL